MNLTQAQIVDGEAAEAALIPVMSSTIVPTTTPRPRFGGLTETLPTDIQSVIPICKDVPTDIPKSSNTYYTLDTETAAQLGISYTGSGNAEFDRKSRVFVREFMKYGECESTDGKAQLLYGAVWRATVAVDQTDASGKLNFAVVAASATLKNVTAQVQINTQGFSPDARTAIETANADAMAATSQGLNVTTFVKFTDQVEKAIRKAMESAVASPLQLIAIKPHATNDLEISVARTIAIAHIARGRDVAAAIEQLPVRNSSTEKAVHETYAAICGPATQVGDKLVQMTAQRLIQGVNVPIPFWR